MIDLVKECAGAARIGITGHIKPDGDCVSSVMALWQFLKKVMPQAQIDVMIEEPQDIFTFIKGVSEIKYDYADDTAYDVMIVADSVKERCGAAEKYIKTAGKVINIDHHISNPGVCDVNEIIPQASSTAEVIYELMTQTPVTKALIDEEMARTLYIGIIHDSGVMQYSNTSPKTLRVVADLISYGFDFPKLIDETFYEKTSVQSKLLGHVLTYAYPMLSGKVMVGTTDLETLKALGASQNDTSGIVNELRIIRGVVVAIYLHEIECKEENGNVDVSHRKYKASLRSCTDDVNVAKVCEHFGGGGHVRAAGCTIEGEKEDIAKALAEQIALQMEDGR